MAYALGGRDGQALAMQTPTPPLAAPTGANGQWYRECRGCGEERIDIYKEAPGPHRCKQRARRVTTQPLLVGARCRPGGGC
jgi:hypothetical protein